MRSNTLQLNTEKTEMVFSRSFLHVLLLRYVDWNLYEYIDGWMDRWRSCDLLLVEVLISCRSYHFELPLTKSDAVVHSSVTSNFGVSITSYSPRPS